MQEAARRVQQRSYRPITEEEERQTLLPSEQLLKDQDKRDKNVYDAVDTLSLIFLLLSYTIIFILILLFINEYTNDSIPIWGIFLVIWFSHLLLLILTIRIIRLIVKSLFHSNNDRFTQKWHQTNEKRIPLIQFIFYHLAWILGLSLILLIYEILLFLYYYQQLPLWSSLIPLYIITGILTLNSIICKSTQTSLAITYSLLLILIIMINIYILYPLSLSLSSLFIPVFIIISIWISLTIYIWINYILSNYRLKSFQIEALSFYTISFIVLLLSLVSLLLYYNDDTFYGYNYQKIAIGCAIISICCFFIGLYRVIVASLSTAIRRMGAERPLSLIQLDNGGWDIDDNNNYENFIILGEVETNAPIFVTKIEKTVIDRYICGCCNSTIEMISSCSNSNGKQNDDASFE